jgi:hypothetical protein
MFYDYKMTKTLIISDQARHGMNFALIFIQQYKRTFIKLDRWLNGLEVKHATLEG